MPKPEMTSITPSTISETPTTNANVTTRVFDVYSDATVIYPGHGDDTTLGAERPHLEEWRERRW